MLKLVFRSVTVLLEKYMSWNARFDRLEELAAEGVIGGVAETNLAFMGAQFDLSTILEDTGPAAAQLLLDEGVDAVVLTPV